MASKKAKVLTKKTSGLGVPPKQDSPPAMAREPEGGIQGRFRAVRQAFQGKRSRRLTQSNYLSGKITHVNSVNSSKVQVNNPRYEARNKLRSSRISGYSDLTSNSGREETSSIATESVAGSLQLRTSTQYAVLRGFDFSALELSAQQLVDSCVNLLMDNIGVLTLPDVKESSLYDAVQQFVCLVYKNYKITSYHSFYHATDVMQSMYYFCKAYFPDRLDDGEVFMLCLIALLHDIGHPGGNIDFLHKIGVLSEFKSLEEYHVHLAVKIVRQSSLFSGNFFPMQTQLEFYELLEYLILSTDMAKHNDVLQRGLKKQMKKTGKVPREHLAVLMKMCDLTNVIRDFKDAVGWSKRLSAEFTSLELLKKKSDKSDCSCALCAMCTGSEVESRRLCIVQQMLIAQGPDMGKVGTDTANFIVKLVFPVVDTLKGLSEDLHADLSERLEYNLRQWRAVISRAHFAIENQI